MKLICWFFRHSPRPGSLYETLYVRQFMCGRCGWWVIEGKT